MAAMGGTMGRNAVHRTKSLKLAAVFDISSLKTESVLRRSLLSVIHDRINSAIDDTDFVPGCAL